jgi:hypothetical protein
MWLGWIHDIAALHGFRPSHSDPAPAGARRGLWIQ